MLTSYSILKQGRTIASKDRSESRNSLFRLLKQCFRPQLSWFLAGTFFAAITSAAAASYGYLLKLVVEGLEALASPETQTVPNSLWWLIAIIAFAAFVRAIALYLMTILNNTGVQRAVTDVQSVQFDALTDGDFARVTGAASGEFVSRFVNDVNALRDAGLRLANNLTKGVLTVIAVLITMLIMDWKLTLIMIVVYPLAFGPVISLGNRVRKRAKRAQSQIGEVTSLLSEAFQGARITKAYGLEDYQKNRARLGFMERARLFLAVLRDKAAVDPILEVTGGIGLVGILALTAWRIAEGDTSLGNFVGIVGAVAVMSPELRALGTLNAVAQEGGAAADRVYDVLDKLPDVTDAEDAKALTDVRGDIRFHDVHFAYPDGTKALNGLSFEARAGETIAIVGASGAGKSTVFNLLMRLYDTSSGCVSIDSQDVRLVTGQSLRGSMALVAQDAALFDDTIENNIRLGRLEASRTEIEEAAHLANAHDFISNMPNGYASLAGEAGRNLSGGQRQRIALARAMLRGGKVLLLDEATSALDAESEAKVQAALGDYAQDRTTLIIAHRLSTVRSADRIIVLDQGRVAEEGDHDELIARNGLYKKLAELQLN